MTKYIVKNCPALLKMVTINSKKGHETLFDSCSEGKHCLCKDRTDCPIKQVVEMCKHNLCDSSACILAGTERCNSECCFFHTTDLAAEILQSLQVEEVKNGR